MPAGHVRAGLEALPKPDYPNQLGVIYVRMRKQA
jgi:hypothetical protein